MVDNSTINMRKALILLAFLVVENFVLTIQNLNFTDKFMSLFGKTPIKFLFPQDFVEKCFFDKIFQKSKIFTILT